jgi:hypothetical protein
VAPSWPEDLQHVDFANDHSLNKTTLLHHVVAEQEGATNNRRQETVRKENHLLAIQR